MLVPIPHVQIGVGIAVIVVSVPLIFRLVPPNHFYGVRTRKAFVSTGNWYAINAFGGKAFLAYGAFLIAIGFFSKPYAPAPTSPWAPVVLTVSFLPLVVVIIAIRGFSSRYPDE